jgi:hypothetical protein
MDVIKDPHLHDRMLGRQPLSLPVKKEKLPEVRMIWTCKCGHRNLVTFEHCFCCGNRKP